MRRIAETPSPEEFARFGAAMQNLTIALRVSTGKTLLSPELQTNLEILAMQLKPLTPLLARMALSEAEMQRPYLCRRHKATIPAGCHCPLCIEDGSHNAGLTGKE